MELIDVLLNTYARGRVTVGQEKRNNWPNIIYDLAQQHSMGCTALPFVCQGQIDTCGEVSKASTHFCSLERGADSDLTWKNISR